MRRIRLAVLTITVLVLTVGSVLAPRTARAGGGCHEPVTDAHGTTVELKELCIIPGVIRVNVGETITWVNRDPMPHTVTGAGIRSGDGLSWGSLDELAHSQAFTHVFERDGVYPYYCWLHPGMVGAVVVGDGNAAAYPAVIGGALPTPAAPEPRPAAHRGASLASRPVILAGLALGAVVALGCASAGVRSIARRRGARPQTQDGPGDCPGRRRCAGSGASRATAAQ